MVREGQLVGAQVDAGGKVTRHAELVLCLTLRTDDGTLRFSFVV